MLGDRAVMARVLAYLFGSGAALAMLGLLLPESVAVDNVRVLAPATAACAVATVLVLAVLAMGSRILRLWTFQCILACGTVLITAAIHFSGEISAVYVMFYVWVTLYAFYFFSPTQATLQLAFLALAYSVVVFGQEIDAPLVRWLVPIGTLIVAGALISVLKDRAKTLIARLSDAARTDTLTGLLNRRGLEELLELELERARRTNRPLSLVLLDIDGFKRLNDRLGHGAGDEALRSVSEMLVDATRRLDVIARLGGDEFVVVMPDSDEHEGYVMAERIRRAVRDAFRSELGGITASFGVAGFPHHGSDWDGLMYAADRALYDAKELGRDRTVIHNVEIAGGDGRARELPREAPESPLATVIGLVEVLDRRDTGTPDHARTVAHYAELTARELGLPRNVVGRVGIGAMLHDVGKIGVSESVLRKPGPLTDDEWHEIRSHPELGARILGGVEDEDIRTWVLAHHERPDGKGYPRGLTDEEIPMGAKIIAVAEAFEAMTSERGYRPALSPEEAREELGRAAGTQFDEDVLEAFFRVLEQEVFETDAVVVA
jgi:diguanylate cyclase (GGDEF)-like protein